MSKSNLHRWLWLVAGAGLYAIGCAGTYSAGVAVTDPYARPYYPPPEVHYAFPVERFAALAHELDDRSARAHYLAEQHAASYGPREQEFFEQIHHFSDVARAFHYDFERGELRDVAELHARIAHMRDDAQATDDAIRRARAFPEVWDEWAGVIRVLNRMLQMVG